MSETPVDVELRQSKYLNNVIEQDHRAVKRITDPILRFKYSDIPCSTTRCLAGQH
jgi:transposase-like protein